MKQELPHRDKGNSGLNRKEKTMTEYTINNNLAASCNLIADELEAHANGRAYTDENGDVVIFDSEEEPSDEMEYRGIQDFINETLDIEVTCGLSGDYRGAKLYMTVGGPTIWVDTQTGFVEGRWSTDSYSKWVDSDAIDELNEAIEEIFEAR